MIAERISGIANSAAMLGRSCGYVIWGVEDKTHEILGITLPQVTIPVRPGRNLAVIMELAAMNNRQKKMGFNAAQALANDHDYAIDAGLF